MTRASSSLLTSTLAGRIAEPVKTLLAKIYETSLMSGREPGMTAECSYWSHCDVSVCAGSRVPAPLVFSPSNASSSTSQRLADCPAEVVTEGIDGVDEKRSGELISDLRDAGRIARPRSLAPVGPALRRQL